MGASGSRKHWLFIHVYVDVYVCMHACMYICVCAHVCTCVFHEQFRDGVARVSFFEKKVNPDEGV